MDKFSVPHTHFDLEQGRIETEWQQHTFPTGKVKNGRHSRSILILNTVLPWGEKSSLFRSWFSFLGVALFIMLYCCLLSLFIVLHRPWLPLWDVLPFSLPSLSPAGKDIGESALLCSFLSSLSARGQSELQELVLSLAQLWSLKNQVVQLSQRLLTCVIPVSPRRL